MARCAAVGDYNVLTGHEHVCEREKFHKGFHRCRNFRMGCKTKWASCNDILRFNARTYYCTRYDGHHCSHLSGVQTWRDSSPRVSDRFSDCNEATNAGNVFFRHDGQHVCRKPHGHDGPHICKGQYCPYEWEAFICFDSGECELAMNHNGAHQKADKYWVGDHPQSGAQRVISEIVNSCARQNLSMQITIRDDGTYNLDGNVDLADVLARLNAPTNFTGLVNRRIRK